MDKKIVLEKTPFVFEDGNIYYFDIHKGSILYNHLFVYKKVIKDERNIFHKLFGLVKEVEVHECLNEGDGGLIDDGILDINKVKRVITKIIYKNVASKAIEGWDGFVGDVPEEMKKAIKREAALNKILNEDEENKT